MLPTMLRMMCPVSDRSPAVSDGNQRPICVWTDRTFSLRVVTEVEQFFLHSSDRSATLSGGKTAHPSNASSMAACSALGIPNLLASAFQSATAVSTDRKASFACVLEMSLLLY